MALTGTVEDAGVRQLAEDALEGISGIKAVYNQLQVQSDESGEPE